MPPKPTSIDDMVEALREADEPVLDADGLGDRVGLAARTIRDRREELDDDDRVGSMKVGQATVWYHKEDPSSPGPDLTADEWRAEWAQGEDAPEDREAVGEASGRRRSDRSAEGQVNTIIERLAGFEMVALGLVLCSAGYILAALGSTAFLLVSGAAFAVLGMLTIWIAVLAQFAIGGSPVGRATEWLDRRRPKHD